ncbi:MAG: thrombospondin type 3 repeat-containing protein, partial [Verrucomicrobiota bacterium]
SIQALFDGQLTGAPLETNADHILKWDPLLQDYQSAFKAEGTAVPGRNGFWFKDDTAWTTSSMSLHPGEAFWIENRQNFTQTVFLSGRVALSPSSQVVFREGLNTFSYPYSSLIPLNNTTLFEDGAFGGLSLTNADVITETINSNRFFLLHDTNSVLDGLWLNENEVVANEVLGLGRGYWYQRIFTNLFIWNAERPYDADFPENDDPPHVAAMTLNPAGDEMTLTIHTLGTSGEHLEIYYQDLTATDRFESASGWLVAEENLDTAGQQTVLWTDDGSGGREKVDGVFARIYLVGRGDIDSDGDGIPDAREVAVHGTDPGVAQTTVFTSPTLIAATNLTYEGETIVVDGTTLTIDGSHFFAHLHVTNGGTINHSAGRPDGVSMSVHGTVIVNAGSSIDVSGLGRLPTAEVTGRSGGSYGGLGENALNGTSNPTYGNEYEPIDLGTGGQGSNPCFGGGRIRLTANLLNLNGTLLAEGEDGPSLTGGGSGGSIWLDVGSICGFGSISVAGGDRSTTSSGGGGAGRIALYYNNLCTFDVTNNIITTGGIAGGGAGSLYVADKQEGAVALASDPGPGDSIESRNTITLQFSLPITISSFTPEDIRLTLAGVTNAATAVVPLSPAQFRIDFASMMSDGLHT